MTAPGTPAASPRRALRLLAALLPACVLPACTLVQLRDEARHFYSATVLVGRVSAPPGWHGPVVVVATTERHGAPLIAHQVRLHEPGGYELIVPDGRYLLHAYGDRDGNGRPDDDDPAASQPAPIDVRGTGMVIQLDLPLNPGAAAAVRRALPPQAEPPPQHSTQAGAIADLDAPAFSADSGSQGYWAPMDSFRRTGGNVYFVETYDPARTPVLFVHGAAGSAQDWRAFIDRLDRRRYQAWIFQYPSGAALDSMAHLLYWKLLNLQMRYRFERLHLVAHSMGGLVVRRLLLDHGHEFATQLGVFVSLSTPWGGEASADLGVNHSPAVVPSWRDMQPGGPFLAGLYQRPLPAHISHMLLFGHRGGYSLVRPTTDGTVTLASQLRPQAQAEAKLVMGFDEDHTSILASPQVIGHAQRLLGSTDPTGSMPAGGRLQVTLTGPDGGAAPVGVVPSLALVPMGNDGAPPRHPMLLPLSTDKGVTPLGPIAPGVYEASLAVPAYRSQPARQRITVAPGGISPLAFSLSPQGTLYGYVGADGDAIARPAGSYRAPHPTVQIRRIVLDGPGGPRTLVPRRSGDPELLNAYLDGHDDAVGAQFSFVGLAEGEHVLTIVADGYAPHVSRHHVLPGRATPLAPVVLSPAR